MGSETSRDFRDNSLISNNIHSFDLDGIKTTEESSTEDENNQKFEKFPFIDEKNENFTKIKRSQNKVPVTFEWDKGGNSVYVTGNFCNWKQFFLMKKNENDIYCLKLK